ncbi:hypothetical protein SBADM41S_03090 [Streptomyces badius]
MTRVSTRTDRQRYGSRAPFALGWVLFLLAMLFCCSATASSAAVPVAAGRAEAATVRTFTPTPDATFEPVVLASAPDRGPGLVVPSTRTVAVVPQVSSAPVAELAALTAAKGERAEVLFLRLMTVHHRAGADMARAAAGAARTDAIRNLAEGMVRGQRSEIGLMADMLKDRGAKP